jgi:bifunctional DNA-binding transcriptional regulator/antitoxin component of YhaV-PrlF toxin-antitoxin module
VPRLRLHYEGWVALPEPFRRKLGLERGDEVEAELVDGTIVLRPSKGSAKVQGEDVAAEAVPPPSALAAAALSPEQLPAEPEAPPAPKRRGRPPKAKA